MIADLFAMSGRFFERDGTGWLPFVDDYRVVREERFGALI
jgi:hypothetical protein